MTDNKFFKDHWEQQRQYKTPTLSYMESEETAERWLQIQKGLKHIDPSNIDKLVNTLFTEIEKDKKIRDERLAKK